MRLTLDYEKQGDERGRASDTEQEAACHAVLSLSQVEAFAEIADQVARIGRNATIAQAKLDYVQHIPIPEVEKDDLSLRATWPTAVGLERDAVLQPPKLSLVPPTSMPQSLAGRSNATLAEMDRS